MQVAETIMELRQAVLVVEVEEVQILLQLIQPQVQQTLAVEVAVQETTLIHIKVLVVVLELLI